jgi:hypothetical protein
VIGSSIVSWRARGAGLAGETISVIAFTGLVMFAGFFIAALANTRSPLIHSRLMAFATFSVMQAVSGRLFLTALLGGNPELLRPGLLPPAPLVPTMVPHLAFDLVLLATVAIHDRRKLGRIQAVTWIGGSVLLGVHATRHMFAATPLWSAIASGLARL